MWWYCWEEGEEEERDATCSRRSETFEWDRCGAAVSGQGRHADTPTSSPSFSSLSSSSSSSSWSSALSTSCGRGPPSVPWKRRGDVAFAHLRTWCAGEDTPPWNSTLRSAYTPALSCPSLPPPSPSRITVCGFSDFLIRAFLTLPPFPSAQRLGGDQGSLFSLPTVLHALPPDLHQRRAIAGNREDEPHRHNHRHHHYLTYYRRRDSSLPRPVSWLNRYARVCRMCVRARATVHIRARCTHARRAGCLV